MMRVDAYVVVRDINPRGLPSLHREPFLGKPLLHHVIETLQKVNHIHEIALICEEIDPFLKDCKERFGVRLHNSTLPDIPRRDRMRRCRRWSVAAWRGGLDYASAYDEDCWPAAMAIVHEAHPCDFIYQVGAEWPCLDPVLSEAVIDHAQKVMSSAKLIFHQASPGFIGAVYSPTTVRQMAEGQMSLRDALAVNNKGAENADEAIGPGNFDVNPVLAQNPWRFTADTPRQLTWLEKCHSLLKKATSEDWVMAAQQQPFIQGPPRDIQLELVGPQKELMSEALFNQLKQELLSETDSLITLDGRESITHHPEWLNWAKDLIQNGAHGVHLRLNAQDLQDAHVNDLLNSHVTVLSFDMEGTTLSDAYTERIQKLCEQNDRLNGPLISLELPRRKNLIPQWEAFWDRWFPITDNLLWRYPSDHLGQFDSQADLNLTRRFRAPCRKLFTEVIVYHDGQIPLCREDWNGKHAVATFPDQSLGDIAQLHQDRWKEHQQQLYQDPCNNCQAWDRLTS